jgi:hypothetical protein
MMRVEPGMFRSLSARWHPFSPFESEFCTLNASLPTLRPKGERSSREYLNTVNWSLSVQACCVVSHRKTTDLVKETADPTRGGTSQGKG